MRALLTIILACTLAAISAQHVYPLDSLTTRPGIPSDAVKIPPGRASGPKARLSYAIYSNIRFPRVALTTKTAGKIIVFGVVDASGEFKVDSATLFNQQAAIVLDGDKGTVVKEDVRLGTVTQIEKGKKKVIVGDFPKGWSAGQKEIVREAIRVAFSLPTFSPGTKDGKPVDSYFEIPVVFRHQGTRRG